MRFIAKLNHGVDLFIKIVQTVSKLAKECVIHLAPKKVRFIIANDVHDGVQVWSGINTGTLFSEWIMESLNGNEISFSVNLENLLRGLKSAQFASDIKVKLTKNHMLRYLSLYISLQSPQVLTVTQDIPINLLSAATLARLTEPNLPDPEVHIMMPPLKLVRTVVDRMKNVCDYLTITANMDGLLRLSVETNMVTIATFYKNLNHPTIEGRSPPRRDDKKQAEVKVDIKTFAKFLYSYQVSPSNVICCLVEGKAAVFYVYSDDLCMAYYIPVIVS